MWILKAEYVAYAHDRDFPVLSAKTKQKQKHKPVQIGILKTEFKGTEGGQGYITPEKFKARLMWAHRVVASDCIRSGAGEESDSCACGSQPPSHQPSKSSGNLTSTGKKKVQGNHLPATCLARQISVIRHHSLGWVMNRSHVLECKFDLLWAPFH